MIIFDASALVSAALKADSVPERALLGAEEVDVFALSAAVDAEIATVLSRAAVLPHQSVSAKAYFCGKIKCFGWMISLDF